VEYFFDLEGILFSGGAAVALLPCLFEFLEHKKKPLLPWALAAILLPLVLAVLSTWWDHSWAPALWIQAAAYQVSFSSLLVSLVWWRIREQDLRILRAVGVLALSVSLSGALFLLTPSIQWVDALWGVVPGPVSMDPLISIEPFLMRLSVWAICFVIILITGLRWTWPASTWVLLFYAVGIVWSFVFNPSPFTFAKRYQENFEHHHHQEGLSVYANLPPGTNLDTWVDLFHSESKNLLTQLRERFPVQAQDFHFDVYLYGSDEEKRQWLGAHKVQIGNFARVEAHFSGDRITPSLVRHELAHLIHGQIGAPNKTFMNPFIFEGLAMALEGDQTRIQEGYHLIQVLNEKGDWTWPQKKNFYERYPAAVAYRLAAAHADWKWQRGLWPWEGLPLKPQDFPALSLSASERVRAEQLLALQPLSSDFRLRECAYILHRDGDFSRTPQCEPYASRL
jgi:hypothetical protein